MNKIERAVCDGCVFGGAILTGTSLWALWGLASAGLFFGLFLMVSGSIMSRELGQRPTTPQLDPLARRKMH